MEEGVTAEEIKAAQGIVGEVLRVSIRSRPNSLINYAVSLMGREVAKRPRWPGGTDWPPRIGALPLLYAVRSANLVIVGPAGEAFQKKDQHRYAPRGEQSVQGFVAMIGGATIQWETSR